MPAPGPRGWARGVRAAGPCAPAPTRRTPRSSRAAADGLLAAALGQVAAGAAAIYRATGRGDTEFAVDRLFHEALERDPAHLPRVTAVGWEVEGRMARLVAGLDRHEPERVLDEL